MDSVDAMFFALGVVVIVCNVWFLFSDVISQLGVTGGAAPERTINVVFNCEESEFQCGAAGGDWVCTADRAGCFDITAWNSRSGCSAGDVQALKAACSVLGGDWSCTATSVGYTR